MDVSAKCIATVTTYLEMFEPPADQISPPGPGLAICHLETPSLSEYRFLYNGVGGDYCWVDRNRMADADLRRLLSDPAVEVHRLDSRGRPAGFAELDRRQASQIELAYFGLFPAYVGQGLGKYFLNWVLHRAWSYSPGRVWVHTCDLDHPRALSNYLAAGFRVYDRQTIQQPISG